MKTFIYIVLLLSITHSMPYIQSLTLSEKNGDTYWLDITDDGSVLVAGDVGST